MPNIDRLTEFAAVADAQSISGAARALGLERATLSRRMSRLESELGVRLLHRSTRRLVLTPAGEQLQRRAQRVVAEASDAWNAVRRMDDTPRGRLRVATIGDALDGLFIDYVRDFPEVELEVVDTPGPVDLVTDGIDVAIRIGPVANLEWIARRVDAAVERLVVASPAYLERNGAPTSWDTLDGHRCIVCNERSWPLRTGGVVAVPARLASDTLRLRMAAARAGAGLALLPAPPIQAELTSGALVPVLRETVGDIAPVSIVFADRDYLAPKVRVFIDRAVPVLEAAYPT